ncbi:hypothetical protein EJB05_35257 [Eragrostis curvula]|uniref:CASP-like protein n=1 Tax=Eragrostis curvula TaxID=38414 RepID=A0A5J9U649_9POAL|nr:hypothetical protein EJB05_35257 [Eragrostis curvula]
MALSRKAWVAAVLCARLLMVAFLAMSVELKYANHTRLDYSSWDNYYQLQSYTYAVAAAVIGMVGNALQIPVAVYLLCTSKRTPPSVLALDISMYTDIVVTTVLASGVGAGFGATKDALQIIKHGVDWTNEKNGSRDDLIRFFNKGNVAISLLLVGMVLSVFTTVASARLRARATNDDLAED